MAPLQPHLLQPIVRRITMQTIARDLGDLPTPDTIAQLAELMSLEALAATIVDLEQYRRPGPGLVADIFATLAILWRAGLTRDDRFDGLVALEDSRRPRRNQAFQERATAHGRPIKADSEVYYPRRFREL